MPVAMNCVSVPAAALGLVGDTWSKLSVAEVTVSVVLTDFIPNVAVIVVEPATTEVAKPFALTAATDAVSESQATEAVRSWLVPSE